jgi:phosphatidylserine/phosphatidylglycerophosphate/cardiolipin synthase-like enzyme
MARFLPALLLAAVCLAPTCGCNPGPLPPIEVYFSPKGGATEAVVEELDRAQKTVLIQAYSFTSKPIAEALLQAHKRGVRVKPILDGSQRTEKYSEADFLLHAGIPVLIDAKHAIAHNKIIIIDDQVVITGSFNFTTQAERSNAENLLVIRDTVLAQQYTENWHQHEAHSEPYAGKEAAAEPATQPQHLADSLWSLFSSNGQYVSSSGSGVFHRSSCKSVAKISEHNRMLFATRDEALRAGKKPCHECTP